MRFEKVYIEGKEYYRKIEDENEGYASEGGTPDDAGEEKPIFERVKETSIAVGKKIKDGAILVGEKIKSGAQAIFCPKKESDDEIKAENLLSLLPNMSDEQKHSLVSALILSDEALMCVEPARVFAELSPVDSDRLFVALVSLRGYDKDLSPALGSISPNLLERII